MTADVKISRGARRAAIGLLVLVLVMGAANLLASYLQVQASQRKWCATLVTLDDAGQHAPPPASAFGRNLVTDFHDLRQQFGCGG